MYDHIIKKNIRKNVKPRRLHHVTRLVGIAFQKKQPISRTGANYEMQFDAGLFLEKGIQDHMFENFIGSGSGHELIEKWWAD